MYNELGVLLQIILSPHCHKTAQITADTTTPPESVSLYVPVSHFLLGRLLQLQYIVQDEQCQEVTDVWLKETGGGNCCGSEKTRADRSVAEATYQKVMESTLSEDNCFKITTVSYMAAIM